MQRVILDEALKELCQFQHAVQIIVANSCVAFLKFKFVSYLLQVSWIFEGLAFASEIACITEGMVQTCGLIKFLFLLP